MMKIFKFYLKLIVFVAFECENILDLVKSHESIILMLRLLAAMDNFSYVDRLANAVEIESAKQALRESLRIFQSLIRGKDIKRIVLDHREYIVVDERILDKEEILEVKSRIYGGGFRKVVQREGNKLQYIYPIDKLSFVERDIEELIQKIERCGTKVANTLAMLALS